ncbi:MAG: DinB family protein [Acidobacteria bacterium]|nr:DinB family protein [Acidobacteriota bacterium]
MGVTYTQPTDPERLDPVELSERLSSVIRSAVPWLAILSEADSMVPERAGKWSAKEIIGHLTDSAVNNLSRMVRMQIGPERLPGYAQDAWVELQRYRERGWSEVLALWFALNEHIAWTIRHIDRSSLINQASVAGEIVSLGFLIEDYIAHMDHHLAALKAWSRPGEA